jgi:EAL domain-containing protein (putative c-di-GMP-specific phosphodiesterase class I)
VVRLHDGGIVGAEALIRWDHPRRGRVNPADFIPLAEASGAISRIGGWVLDRACADAAAWRDAGVDLEGFSLGVNVSPRQLEHDDVAERVRDALSASGLPPSALLMEVTEGVLMSDPEEMVARLHALRALGVRVGIDDFGTGYSSLSYLERLPVDVVKIDRAFVSRIGRSDPGRGFSRGVIRLVGRLPVTTVAEGIEHAEQVALLQALGCHLGQGFFFSHPLPAERMRALLLHETTDRVAGDRRERADDREPDLHPG